MAIAASGQVSTSNLESEFIGVTPSTKTLDNYLGMANSTTKNTSQFYSKSAPVPGEPSVDFFDGVDITVTAPVNGMGISNARFRIQMATDINFTQNLNSGSYYTWVNSGTLIGTFLVNGGIDHYFRTECNFGTSLTYYKYSFHTIFNPLLY